MGRRAKEECFSSRDGSRAHRQGFTSNQRRALFRALSDPAKLRKNPITARFFPNAAFGENKFEEDRGATAVRDAIIKIAQRFLQSDLQRGLKRAGERSYQAVIRCDIGAEQQKVVAYDLGISVRQLRRERLFAQTRIAEELWAQGKPADSVSLDLALLELAICRQLWEAGQSASAADNLIALASNASTLRHRVRAIVDLTDVLIQQGQVEAVRNTVHQAASAIANSTVNAAERELCASWVNLAQSRIEFASGHYRVGQALEHDAISVMGATSAERDFMEHELYARSLLTRAKRRNVWGEYKNSLEDLDTVEQMSVGASPLPPSFVVEYLTTVGDVALATHGYDFHGYAALQKALTLAEQHGLGRRAVIAGRTLADMQYLFGERPAAEGLVRSCVATALTLGMSDMIAEVALDAAELALIRGDWAEADPYLDLARAHISSGTPSIRLEVAEADSLLLSGRVALALRKARSASKAAAAIRNERLRGTALRIMVKAQFQLKESDYTQTLREMLSALEAHGSKHSLALGLAIAAQIAGNPLPDQSKQGY